MKLILQTSSHLDTTCPLKKFVKNGILAKKKQKSERGDLLMAEITDLPVIWTVTFYRVKGNKCFHGSDLDMQVSLQLMGISYQKANMFKDGELRVQSSDKYLHRENSHFIFAHICI